MRAPPTVMRMTGMSRPAPLPPGARPIKATIDMTPSRSQGWRLHPYQIEGARWLQALQPGRGCLLGDDMGVGKTVQALKAIDRHGRAVVCCPASVARVWRSEAAEWRPDLEVTIDAPLRRPKAGEILVISYDSLPDLTMARFLVPEPMHDVDLILDECQMVTNETALRTRKVRRLRAQCRRTWGLSGTPMNGTPMDLWGVLVTLGLAERLFGSRDAFVSLCGGEKRFITDRRTGRLRQIGHKWGNICPEVNEKLKTVMLRRLLTDVIEMPPLQRADVLVPAPDDLRDWLDGEMKTAWLGLESRQMPPFELLSEARAAMARSRIPDFLEQVKLLADAGPVIAFSAHRDPILALQKLRNAKCFLGETPPVERAALVERFQAGKLRVLGMTIDSGGVGITLTKARSVVFCDEDYNPSLNEQAIRRAYRQGQKGTVLVRRLVTDHPLDLRVSEILAEKTRLIGAVVEGRASG